MKEKFGGSVRLCKARSPKHADSHRWVISGENVIMFAENVLPWLKIKQTQAKLSIYFQQLKRVQKNQPLSDKTYEKYLVCKQIFTVLNKKGPDSTVLLGIS